MRPILADNRHKLLAWMAQPGAKAFNRWVEELISKEQNTLMTSSNPIHIHRAQGALAVLDGFIHIEKDLKGIEKQMSDQKNMEKKAAEAAEAVLP